MPITVNGDIVPEPLILQELERLSQDPQWDRLTDPSQRAERLRAAAEYSAVNRVILEQVIARDSRPLDPAMLHAEIDRRKVAGRCPTTFEDSHLQTQVESQMRFERTVAELVSGAVKTSEAEIESFFEANRENFRTPVQFQAAHILAQVNELQSEPQAEQKILEALAALDGGEEFNSVAERYSDCKGNGGDLGTFAAGFMVEEFEAAIRNLEPGQRTGVFTTPFGFHIAELRGKNTGGFASYEDVYDDIKRVLTTMNQQREYLRQLEVLRGLAVIKRIEVGEPVAP